MAPCGFCKLDSAENKKCVCGKVTYCNESCQKKDWSHHKSSCPPYKVREAPGKGRGLFATRKIPLGKVIFTEAPLLVFNDMEDFIMKYCALRDPEVKSKILGLPDPLKTNGPKDARCSRLKRARFAGLTGNDEYTRAARLAMGNTTERGEGQEGHGLYQLISLINHGCNPNASHCTVRLNPQNRELIALKTINKDEEILINCGQSTEFTIGLRKERMETLLHTHHFICRCPECSLTGKALEENETDRKELQELEKLVQRLENTSNKKSLRKAVAAVQKIVEIFKKLDLQMQTTVALAQCYGILSRAKKFGVSGIPEPGVFLAEGEKFAQYQGDQVLSLYKKAIGNYDLMNLLNIKYR